MARPPVVVTRPEPDASEWVRRLNEAGWPAWSLPLLGMGPPTRPADLQRLAQCRAGWTAYDAVMFVSPQAVRHFFTHAATPLAGSARCWCPGPGTARALQDSGVPAGQIDMPSPDSGQFDSEALWQVVGPWLAAQAAHRHASGQPCRVLVVRGDSSPEGGDPGATAVPGEGSGREWLAAQCRAAGAQVEFCVAYVRHAAPWSLAQRERARAELGSAIWLLSSSEGLPLLGQRLPEAAWATARALTTHPRIAEEARSLGFGNVNTVRPAWADVVRGLESLGERKS